jgi:hypothetical protein
MKQQPAVRGCLEGTSWGRVDPRRAGFGYHAGEGNRPSERLTRPLGRPGWRGGRGKGAFAQYGRLKMALPRYCALAGDRRSRNPYDAEAWSAPK